MRLVNERRSLKQTTVLMQLGTIQTMLCSVVTPKDVTRAVHDVQRSISDEIRGVRIVDGILSRVSDTKLRILSYLLHGCDFLCFNLVNY